MAFLPFLVSVHFFFFPLFPLHLCLSSNDLEKDEGAQEAAEDPKSAGQMAPASGSSPGRWSAVGSVFP